MTTDEMIKTLNEKRDSPFLTIYNFIESNELNEAALCIQEYFNCDEDTAKIVCMDFKTKFNDPISSIPTNLTPKEIARNNQIAQDWSNKVHCPYCNSTNVKKISGFAKVGSVAMFGIFSQKVKKQWHCNNCKSDF